MGEKLPVLKRYVLASSIIMVSIGLTIVVAGAVLAYYYFQTYNVSPVRGDFESTISTLVVEMLVIVVKLAFLATGIWAGSILIKYGFTSLFERKKSREKK